MEKQLTGVELIAKERERQIKLGYDSQHDREHQPMDLVCAADAYICSAEGFAAPQGYSTWPWDYHDFKPKTMREDLIRAGALIAAALDRLNEQTWWQQYTCK